MPISCQYHANIMPISCQYHANIMPISCQYHANIMPISCQYHANIMPISCQYHANIMPISCQSHANLMPISCQYHANIMPISCQYHASIMPVSCQYHANIMPISCQYHANIMPISCQYHAIHAARESQKHSSEQLQASDFETMPSEEALVTCGMPQLSFAHERVATVTCSGRRRPCIPIARQARNVLSCRFQPSFNIQRGNRSRCPSCDTHARQHLFAGDGFAAQSICPSQTTATVSAFCLAGSACATI